MRTSIAAAAFRCFFLAGISVVVFSIGAQPAAGSNAVTIVRLINTAEANYRAVHGRYAGYADLISSGQLSNAAKESLENARAYRAMNLQSSEPLSGHLLRIVVGGNGTAYTLSLTRITDKCGYTLFSDERGVLYEGKAIGCATAAAASFPASGWSPADIDEEVPPVRTDTPCPLAKLLHETGVRAEELVDNLQRFSASDRVDDVEVHKSGQARAPVTGHFNYLAEIRHAASGPFVEEYRESISRDDTPQTHWADSGTAAFALIFHPRYVVDYAVTCEGMGEWQGRPAWQLHFAQRPERGNAFHIYRVANNAYPARLKGRAWISADNFQVLRVETDLLQPLEQIQLQREHSVVEYGPVGFRKQAVQLWLPQSAELYIDHRGHRYHRRHSFSNYQLFWVETGQQVKEPTFPDSQP